MTIEQHTIRLEYCAPCNYLNLALKLVDQTLGQWGPLISSFELVPTAWGTFELVVDDELIYSKWARGRHPKEGELFALLEQRLGPPLAEWVDHRPESVGPDGFPIH